MRIVFLAVCLVLTSSSGGAESYLGYWDRSSGLEACEFTMDYMPALPPTGAVVAVWGGIDNDHCDGWMWIQTGYLQLTGWSSGQWYFESTNENGVWTPPILLGPPGEETSDYGVVRSDAVIDVIVGGVVSNTYNWSDFDDQRFIKAVFICETKVSTDHVPGTADHPVWFTSCSVTRLGGSPMTATLAKQENDNRTNWVIGPAAGGAFHFYDKR